MPNWLDRKKLVGVALSAFSLLCAPAFAQGTGGGNGSGMGGGGGGGGMGNGTFTLQISPGVSLRPLITYSDGRVRATRNAGTGNEHAITQVVDDKVVVAFVSSNVYKAVPGQPSQIQVAVVKTSPTGAPTLAVPPVGLENWPSNRKGQPALETPRD